MDNMQELDDKINKEIIKQICDGIIATWNDEYIDETIVDKYIENNYGELSYAIISVVKQQLDEYYIENFNKSIFEKNNNSSTTTNLDSINTLIKKFIDKVVNDDNNILTNQDNILTNQDNILTNQDNINKFNKDNVVFDW